MRDAEFRDLVGAKTRVITWPPAHSVTVTSHNRLLDYAWGDGIKTGATAQSKMVLVGSGTPGALKVPLIVVTMREPTRDQEERDAVALFTWGAGLYEERQLVRAGDEVEQLAVTGGAPSPRSPAPASPGSCARPRRCRGLCSCRRSRSRSGRRTAPCSARRPTAATASSWAASTSSPRRSRAPPPSDSGPSRPAALLPPALLATLLAVLARRRRDARRLRRRPSSPSPHRPGRRRPRCRPGRASSSSATQATYSGARTRTASCRRRPAPR